MSLCLACGLCCQGILFDYGLITAAELAEHGADWHLAGLDWYAADGEVRFRLPCPAYDNSGHCRCYGVRPHVCAAFQCRLLVRYQAGTCPESEALRIIQRIKRLCTGLQRQLQTHPAVLAVASAAFHEQLRQFREWYAACTPEQRAPVSHYMAQQRALLLLFGEYFYPVANTQQT